MARGTVGVQSNAPSSGEKVLGRQKDCRDAANDDRRRGGEGAFWKMFLDRKEKVTPSAFLLHFSPPPASLQGGAPSFSSASFQEPVGEPRGNPLMLRPWGAEVEVETDQAWEGLPFSGAYGPRGMWLSCSGTPLPPVTLSVTTATLPTLPTWSWSGIWVQGGDSTSVLCSPFPAPVWGPLAAPAGWSPEGQA